MATTTQSQGYGTIGIGFMNFTNSTRITDQDDSFMVIKSRFQTYAESVHRILQTSPLERPHEQNIGCILRRLLFEPNDFYLERAASFAVREAIVAQEPRLNVVSMKILVLANEKKLRMSLILVEKSTQAKFALDEEVQL